MAHRLADNSSMVCITDGDTDALVQLRENVRRNKMVKDDDNKEVTAHQLIWGRESTQLFLQRHCTTAAEEEQTQQQPKPQLFDVLLASDIIYARVIVEPLWETVQELLRRTPEAVFVMAYARRDVPVTIDMVLEHAEECGFNHKLVDEHPEGIWVYEFRWKDEYIHS